MKEFYEDEIHHELYLHVLWSTLRQKPIISSYIGQHLYAYICDLALTYECYVIGGRVCEDHLQLVLKFNPNLAIEILLTSLKVATSLWIRTNYPEMKDFEWQKSDFAFTVGFEEVGSVLEKIKNTKSFLKDVYLLLNQTHMEYDKLEVLE
jgi:putative transposase